MNHELWQIDIARVSFDRILPLRRLFLEQNKFQIRYNAVHERGWSDSYLITVDGKEAGYCSVKGMDEIKDRDTIFEFFLVSSFVSQTEEIFTRLIDATKVAFVECQSNEPLLSAMLSRFCDNIHSDVILFGDASKSTLQLPAIVFRKLATGENVFEHRSEPVGAFGLEMDSQIVATGGYLTHYNFPFADLFMEVRPDHRKRGMGSYLIQKLKEECYAVGHVPAARCNKDNTASAKTLLKAGMGVVGEMMVGRVR